VVGVSVGGGCVGSVGAADFDGSSCCGDTGLGDFVEAFCCLFSSREARELFFCAGLDGLVWTWRALCTHHKKGYHVRRR
jgi:hypothetical protein